MSTSKRSSKLSVRELVLLALLGALMFGSKVVLSAIPNVHLNALFILLAVLLFGRRALYSVFVYVLLEGLVYGFGIWFISYLYASRFFPRSIRYSYLSSHSSNIPNSSITCCFASSRVFIIVTF